MSSARLEMAESLLREAVLRSRERQAASVAVSAPRARGGTCGLGEKAAIDLDLSQRGRELYDRLWPDGLEGDVLDRVRKILETWVVEQDAIDRRRNHHMKAMRMKHGFARDEYPPGVAREFEAGLERVNEEENSGRRSAGQDLASL